MCDPLCVYEHVYRPTQHTRIGYIRCDCNLLTYLGNWSTAGVSGMRFGVDTQYECREYDCSPFHFALVGFFLCGWALGAGREAGSLIHRLSGGNRLLLSAKITSLQHRDAVTD